MKGCRSGLLKLIEPLKNMFIFQLVANISQIHLVSLDVLK